jgi:predicted ABC-type ATPase
MFLPLAHVAAIYDNSLEPPVLIAEKDSDSFTVRDAERWKFIEDATGEKLHG